MTVRTRLTIEEFDRFTALPENANRMFEFIGGEIVEVVSQNYSSQVAGMLLTFINLFVFRNNLGHVTGADGGYMVSGEKYIPDVAYISCQRQPEPCEEAWNPNAPDLAVEVLSPSNTDNEMRIKLVNYLNAGTTVLVADPEPASIELYVPAQPPKKLTLVDTLTLEHLLPGFTLEVRDCFPKSKHHLSDSSSSS